MAVFTDQGKGNEAFAAISNILKSEIATGSSAPGGNNVSNDKSVLAMLERQRQNGIIRTPWVMSTTEWLSKKPAKALIWGSNPSDISWQMPQRSVHAKNLFGTVLHVWPDTKRGTFFDEIVLTLRLQSGNIIPVIMGTGKWVASGGLANFYDFMQLVDAPKLTLGTPPRANLVSIQYSSNLFPKLTLIGMFDPSGIQFTDSSAEPNQVMGWTATFVVYDTYPRLSSNTSTDLSNAALLQLWLDERVTKQPSFAPKGSK